MTKLIAIVRRREGRSAGLGLVFAALVAVMSVSVRAEMVTIPWNGDYPINGETVWSFENRYRKSALTRSFMNGAPEEQGRLQHDGVLQAELMLPKQEVPVPFVILMHGCTGATDPVVKRWSHRAAEIFRKKGFGVLVLDSFTTRGVRSTCGSPNYHWGVRRVEDAYSAMDYLIKSNLAKADGVFLLGRSNGALAAIVSAERLEVDTHPNRFAAAFSISPTCLGLDRSVLVLPLVIFVGNKDDAVKDLGACVALFERAEAPVQVVEFDGVTHGYEDVGVDSVFHGWRMKYDADADRLTISTIVERLTQRDFKAGHELIARRQ
jgi:dienelactone hydrolase